MFGLIKKTTFISLLSFIGLIARVFEASDQTKCISLNNQPCTTRPTLMNINSDKCSQGWYYYSFLVKISRCNGS